MKNLFKNITVGVFAMMMSVSSVFAEVPAGFKASSQMEKFRTDMLSTAKSMTTMKSDFVQTKHISGMTKDIESTGEFCFKKEDKLSLEYKKPMVSQIVMNGAKIKMTSGGRSTVMDGNSNPAIANLKNMMSSCLSGQLPTNSQDIKLDLYENDTQYLVYVTPKEGSNLAKRTDHMEVVVTKADYTIVSFKMIEKPKANGKGSDYMQFTFTNMKRNIAIDDSVFKVQ